MNTSDVCAVIYGGAEAGPGALDAAAGQGSAPAVCLSAPDLAAALDAGTAAGSEWIWLIDAWSRPQPDALAALIQPVAELSTPPPVLLASLSIDAAGVPHPAALPRHEVFDKEHVVNAVERRLVAVRAAADGSVLLRGAAARAAAAAPRRRRGLEMLELSARLLRGRDRRGYLVPASLVVCRRPLPPRLGGHGWLQRARLLAGDAWTPNERLWEALQLGQAAARALGRSR